LDSNQGASAARNRGLEESCADFVVFIDDDVVPDESLLQEYAQAIRKEPTAGGFVGCTTFPKPLSFQAVGVKLSGCTFFWDAATHMKEMPWGVTANLCVKRGAERFDLRFPRTGGGEDIDFCLKVQSVHGKLLPAPSARAVHPWWDHGSPALKRFFGWALGDGHLQFMYPHLSYRNWPNVWDTTVLLALLLPLFSFRTWIKLLLWIWLVDLVGDFGTHYLYPVELVASLSGCYKAAAVLWSFLTKNTLELAHCYRNLTTSGLFIFGLGIRFDWFCALYPQAIQDERRIALKRFVAFMSGVLLLLWTNLL
jgi:glycosyltransferase involved in cell wall biosynthesis